MQTITKTVFLTDIYQIYNSPHLNHEAGPVQLRNKVKWDIRYYFCCRGKENLYKFTKETFKLKHNEEQDLRYIEKVQDEKTKNHQDNGPIKCGHMPELKGNGFCPVTSYLTYLYSLDPKCPWLFQIPKKKEFPANGKGVWYAGRMGHNPLDIFVSRMAKLCDLGQFGYTNHSLHSTGITTLKKTKKFSDTQVMVYSGHESLAGLNTYERVSDEDKIAMGFSLSESLIVHQPVQIIENPALPAPANQLAIEAPMPHKIPPVPALPAPPVAPVQDFQNAPNVMPQNAVIPFEAEDPFQNDPDPGIDLMKLIAEAEEQNNINANAPNIVSVEMAQVQKSHNDTHVVAKQVVKKTSSPQVPSFNNCTFHGSITININKN